MACNLYSFGASAAAAALLLIILATAVPTTAARKLAAVQSSTNILSVAQVLGTMKSPLSESVASNYAQLYKQTRSVGDLCQSGHLYCDAQAYDAYYRKVLQPTEEEMAGHKNNIVVFFRASELMVGNQATVVDPRLQSTAIERNRQALNADPQTSLYAYINVIKVPERAFLPEQLAKTLPFTRLSAAQIFHLDESSALVQESSKTIKVCKEAVHEDGTTPLQGEAAACATSLEEFQSLLQSPQLLGAHDANNVEALVTESNLQSDFTGKVVAVSLKASESSRHAVCHNLMYPSAVYFCHYLPNTRVYAVTLRQQSTNQLLQAVAMCHLDTSGWNPRHLAFQNLNALPGHGEACHWVLQGSVTFVPVNVGAP